METNFQLPNVTFPETLEVPALPNGVRASITTAPLVELFDNTRYGYRLYELLAIHRHTDLLPHLAVQIESGASVFTGRNEWDTSALRRQASSGSPISYEAFLSATRETDSAQAWQTFLRGNSLVGLLRKWLEFVAATVRAVRAAPDPLIRYELKRIDEQSHPWDAAFIEAGRELLLEHRPPAVPVAPRFDDSVYHTLERLLAVPSFKSFAYPGDADFHVIRLAAAEQYRRRGEAAFARPKPPWERYETSENSLRVSVLDLRCRWRISAEFEPDLGYRYALPPFPCWMGGVVFYDEGLGPGQLLFDDGTSGLAEWSHIVESQRIGAVAALSLRGPIGDRLRWYEGRGSMALGIAPTAITEFAPILSEGNFREVSGYLPVVATKID